MSEDVVIATGTQVGSNFDWDAWMSQSEPNMNMFAQASEFGGDGGGDSGGSIYYGAIANGDSMADVNLVDEFADIRNDDGSEIEAREQAVESYMLLQYGLDLWAEFNEQTGDFEVFVPNEV